MEDEHGQLAERFAKRGDRFSQLTRPGSASSSPTAITRPRIHSQDRWDETRGNALDAVIVSALRRQGRVNYGTATQSGGAT
jgi:hypothetical protein